MYSNKLLYSFIFIFITTSVVAQSFQPLATVNSKNYTPAQIEIAEGTNGMVTTQHFLATKVGEDILNQGGNAFDASIAIGFTLAVVLPRAEQEILVVVVLW